MPEDQMTPEDAAAGGDGPESAAYWMAEIDAALKREENWRKRAKKVVQRYRADERAVKSRSSSSSRSRANILWANTETLKSALYVKTATPDVRRRFPDAGAGTGKNALSRLAAELIERALSYCADEYDIDSHIEAAVEDVLLPGRAIIWIDYMPPEAPEADGAEAPAADASYADDEDDASVPLDETRASYVYWEDFTHGLARIWADVPWIGRRHAMPLAEFRQEFPDARPMDVGADYELKDASGNAMTEHTDARRVEVWEVWDRASRRRLYIGRGYPTVLKAEDDPYKLKDFFPCPRPLYSVKTNDKLIPEPEYLQYQDQALDLDDVTARITALTDQLKWKGFYDASTDDPEALKALAVADDAHFEPYKGWVAFQQRGGIDGAFGFWPIERIFPVLDALYAHRERLIQTIYEITGISDIVRGQTDPRETKGAQVLKAQFGSMRMQLRQRDVQRFVRDLYRLKADIIASHYPAEVLSAMTNIELPTGEQKAEAQRLIQALDQAKEALQQRGKQLEQQGVPPEQIQQQIAPLMPQIEQMTQLYERAQEVVAQPSWDEMLDLLRSDRRRGYRTDIETDSTIWQDAEAEKASRLEFMTAMQEMLPAAFMAAQQAPAMLPLIREVTLYAVRTFNAGRVMEEALEDAFDDLADNPPPPEEKGDEGGGKAQAEMAQVKAAEAEKKGMALLAEITRKAERDRQELALKNRKLEMESQADYAEAARKATETAAKIRTEMDASERDARESAADIRKTQAQTADILRRPPPNPAPAPGQGPQQRR